MSLYESVQEGRIFLLKADSLEKSFFEEAERIIRKFFGENPEEAEFRMSRQEHFDKLQEARQEMGSERTLSFLEKFLNEIFPNDDLYYDIPRLRAVTTYGHTVPEARPAYFVHRDSWYANPEVQINLWAALSDISEKNCFAFFPDYFQKSVRNNSRKFDLKEWNANGGFQSVGKKIYPRAFFGSERPKERLFSCSKYDILIFSADHLHGTRPNLSGKTRFSADIRVVLKRHSERNHFGGAKDNFSKGSMLPCMKFLKAPEKTSANA